VRHECELAGMLHRALLPMALAVYEHMPFHLARTVAKPGGMEVALLRCDCNAR
jgi:hypothetical protein